MFLLRNNLCIKIRQTIWAVGTCKTFSDILLITLGVKMFSQLVSRIKNFKGSKEFALGAFLDIQSAFNIITYDSRVATTDQKGLNTTTSKC